MNRSEMLAVLRKTRKALNSPNNKFIFSDWDNHEEAVDEIDEWIRVVSKYLGEDTSQLRVLFAPTGPIQEVSMDSGWAELYLELAKEFEKAIGPDERLDEE